MTPSSECGGLHGTDTGAHASGTRMRAGRDAAVPGGQATETDGLSPLSPLPRFRFSAVRRVYKPPRRAEGADGARPRPGKQQEAAGAEEPSVLTDTDRNAKHSETTFHKKWQNKDFPGKLREFTTVKPH